jgi:hypothetical protein
MTPTFKEIRRLQGERVRMSFEDGREVVAQLLCATRDMDGARHLIYNQVESGSPAEVGAGGCFYADAKTLVHMEQVSPGEPAPSRKDWDTSSMRAHLQSEKAWCPRA